MKIGDRKKDRIYGPVELLDVDDSGKATLLIERTGAKCHRPVHWVEAMPKAPMKPCTLRFVRKCLIVVSGIIIVVSIVLALSSYFAWYLSQQ